MEAAAERPTAHGRGSGMGSPETKTPKQELSVSIIIIIISGQSCTSRAKTETGRTIPNGLASVTYREARGKHAASSGISKLCLGDATGTKHMTDSQEDTDGQLELMRVRACAHLESPSHCLCPSPPRRSCRTGTGSLRSPDPVYPWTSGAPGPWTEERRNNSVSDNL